MEIFNGQHLTIDYASERFAEERVFTAGSLVRYLQEGGYLVVFSIFLLSTHSAAFHVEFSTVCSAVSLPKSFSIRELTATHSIVCPVIVCTHIVSSDSSAS